MSASPEKTDADPRLTRWTMWLGGLVSAAAGASLLMKLGGADLFWHVRAGQWIAAHGIPTEDPFSHTADGPWRYTEALAAVLLAGVNGVGGTAGLIVFHMGLAALVAGLVFVLADGRRPASSALVAAAAAAGSHAAMAPKPQMFSYVLFAVLLCWLRESERRGHTARWLLPLPALFALWANLHRGGVLGLAVLFAALVAAALYRRGRAPALLLVLVVSALALMLNPAGAFYLTSAVDVVSRASFATHIAEWAPLTLEGFLQHHWPIGVLAGLGAIGVWLGDREGRRLGTPTLVFLGTALLALRSARLLPFVAIAVAPLAARALDRGMARLPRPRVVDVSALVLGLALIGARYFGAVPPAFRGLGIMESRVPVGIAGFLEASPPPGRMFNSLDFGGYLMFRLGPELQVFVDGRNDTLYDPAWMAEVFESGRSPDAFRRVTDDRDIGFAVVRWSGPADGSFRFLHADPDWVLVHWDDAGAVLVRRTPESASYLEQHGYAQLSLHDAFVRAAHVTPGAEDARFADEVQRALRRSPESLSVRYLSMVLAARLGDATRFETERVRVMQLADERGVDLQPQ